MNNWSTGANWGSGQAPSATDIVYFGSNSDKNCNVDGNVTIAGLIIQPGYDGTISFNDKTVTITGDFIKKDGTLNAGTSKVILAGTGEQKVEFSSSETFYNLEVTNNAGGTVTFNDSFTANELKINPGNYIKFGAEKTFTITTLTGSGTSENLVYLISTSFYDVWNLNLTNSATLSYLAVASCNASAGAYLAAGNSTDLGGNSNTILHSVEITSVLNRYHAKGSTTDATIHYEITGTPGFFADTVKLTIKDKGGVEVYTKTESGNKPIGCYTITWPAAGLKGMNEQEPTNSPFIATVEILKECKGISFDPGDAANERIYIIEVTNLVWEAIDGNLDGDKIYPDKYTSGGSDHSTVNIKATLSRSIPAGQTITVYFRVLDPDDPSSNTTIDPDDWVKVEGEVPGDAVDENSKVEDDDVVTLDGYSPVTLPHTPDGTLLTSALADAYVTVITDASWDDNTTTFQINIDSTQEDDVAAENRDLTSGMWYWAGHVTTAFQAQYANDNDPDGQGARAGVCAGEMGDCLIYFESIRDRSADLGINKDTLEKVVVAHEIGHDFGCDEEEDGLYIMSSGGIPTNLKFSPTSIKKIRACLAP